MHVIETRSFEFCGSVRYSAKFCFDMTINTMFGKDPSSCRYFMRFQFANVSFVNVFVNGVLVHGV